MVVMVLVVMGLPGFHQLCTGRADVVIRRRHQVVAHKWTSFIRRLTLWPHACGRPLAPQARESVALVVIPLISPATIVAVITLGRVGGATDRGVDPRFTVASVMVSPTAATSGTAAASHARDGGAPGTSLTRCDFFYSSY